MLAFPTPSPRIIRYRLVEKEVKIPVIFYRGEVWLTMAQLVNIFGLSPEMIKKWLHRIWRSGEMLSSEYTSQIIPPDEPHATAKRRYYRLELVEELDRRLRCSPDEQMYSKDQ